MLRTKKHAPTPSPFVVFTFGFVVESIKEPGGMSEGVSKCHKHPFIYYPKGN
jgi:hypothetical protein